MNEAEKQTLIAQIAAERFLNVPDTRIAESLNINRSKLRRLVASKEYLEYVKDLGEKAVAHALSAFKSKMEDLEPLAYAALKQNLIDGKLDAVKVWGEFVGVKDKAPGEGLGSGNLTVILPGAEAPKDIEVEVSNAVQDEEN